MDLQIGYFTLFIFLIGYIVFLEIQYGKKIKDNKFLQEELNKIHQNKEQYISYCDKRIENFKKQIKSKNKSLNNYRQKLFRRNKRIKNLLSKLNKKGSQK